MNDLLESSDFRYTESNLLPEITVEEVDNDRFNAILESLDERTLVRVVTNDWKEVGDDAPIVNIPAIPCEVAYLYDTERRVFIVGHFVNQTELVERSQMEDQLPYLKQLSESVTDEAEFFERFRLSEDIGKGRKKYLDFLAKIRDQKNRNVIKAYIFGQRLIHDTDHRQNKLEVKDTTTTLIERIHVYHDLLRQGLTRGNIFDFRSLKKGEVMDKTLYDPTSRKIYVARVKY